MKRQISGAPGQPGSAGQPGASSFDGRPGAGKNTSFSTELAEKGAITPTALTATQ